MSVDSFAEVVRKRIADVFGDTSDLSEELVNTLCNLYYFAEKAQKQNFGGLTDMQEIHPGKSKERLVSLYMSHMSHVTAPVSHAPDLVNSMRSARVKSPDVFSYLEEITLDLFKYCIEHAERKTGIRRSVERKLKRPNEYQNLAKKLKVPYREAP